MRSKYIGLRIARQRYPTYTVVIEEPMMYLIAPSSTGETIDVKSANWLAEVVMDCSGETPKIVRDRPVGAIIDEMAAEFAAIGNLLPKKYFRDKYLNQPDITDDIPNPETTTRSPNES